MIFDFHTTNNNAGRDVLEMIFKNNKTHWVGIRRDIMFVCNNCIQCNQKSANLKKRYIPDKIIIAENENDLFEIDFCYFVEDATTKAILILNGVNHFTKMLYSASGTVKSAGFV